MLVQRIEIAHKISRFETKAEDEGKGLGIQLIKGLSKELKGTSRIETKAGTKLTVEFKKAALTDEMDYVKSKNMEYEA